MVTKEFGLPTKLENDANAAGLAEVLFGAAVGYKDVFYVTVSTGIGTGIIINKKIYHGKNGVAGEGGHVSIDYRSAYRCGCGTYGDIEALAAGPAMARRARVMLEQEHSTPSLLRDLAHGHAEEISPLMIQQAASKGDLVAKAILDETGFLLGFWLASMISLFDPEAIVIGGGVSHIGKRSTSIGKSRLGRQSPGTRTTSARRRGRIRRGAAGPAASPGWARRPARRCRPGRGRRTPARRSPACRWPRSPRLRRIPRSAP